MKWLKNLFKVKKHRHYFSKTAMSWEEGYRWKICMGCSLKMKAKKEEAPRLEEIFLLGGLNPNTTSGATTLKVRFNSK